MTTKQVTVTPSKLFLVTVTAEGEERRTPAKGADAQPLAGLDVASRLPPVAAQYFKERP
jgi:hypothetical protein